MGENGAEWPRLADRKEEKPSQVNSWKSDDNTADSRNVRNVMKWPWKNRNGLKCLCLPDRKQQNNMLTVKEMFNSNLLNQSRPKSHFKLININNIQKWNKYFTN
jgi:hypothetical protein